MRVPGIVVVCLVVSASAVRAERPLARSHRIAVSAGYGIATASMTAFDAGVDAYFQRIAEIQDEFTFTTLPKSGVVSSIELSARYYFAKNLFVETGLHRLSHGATTDVQFAQLPGTISYHNRAYEIPVIVGGYLTFGRRTYIYGGAGPSVLVAAQSDWDYSLGSVSDFAVQRGGGLHALAGIDVLVHPRVGISLTMRYRFVKSGRLDPSTAGIPALQPIEEFDFSGIGGALQLRTYWDWQL